MVYGPWTIDLGNLATFNILYFSGVVHNDFLPQMTAIGNEFLMNRIYLVSKLSIYIIKVE